MGLNVEIRHLNLGVTDADFDDLPGAVHSTQSHVLLQVGDLILLSRSVERDAFATFVQCHIEHLQALSAYNKPHIKASRDPQDGGIVGADLPRFWDTFKDKLDVDSARLHAVNAHHYEVARACAKDEAIGRKLEEHIGF